MFHNLPHRTDPFTLFLIWEATVGLLAAKKDAAFLQNQAVASCECFHLTELRLNILRTKNSRFGEGITTGKLFFFKFLDLLSELTQN